MPNEHGGGTTRSFKSSNMRSNFNQFTDAFMLLAILAMTLIIVALVGLFILIYNRQGCRKIDSKSSAVDIGPEVVQNEKSLLITAAQDACYQNHNTSDGKTLRSNCTTSCNEHKKCFMNTFQLNRNEHCATNKHAAVNVHVLFRLGSRELSLLSVLPEIDIRSPDLVSVNASNLIGPTGHSYSSTFPRNNENVSSDHRTVYDNIPTSGSTFNNTDNDLINSKNLSEPYLLHKVFHWRLRSYEVWDQDSYVAASRSKFVSISLVEHYSNDNQSVSVHVTRLKRLVDEVEFVYVHYHYRGDSTFFGVEQRNQEMHDPSYACKQNVCSNDCKHYRERNINASIPFFSLSSTCVESNKRFSAIESLIKLLYERFGENEVEYLIVGDFGVRNFATAFEVLLPKHYFVCDFRDSPTDFHIPISSINADRLSISTPPSFDGVIISSRLYSRAIYRSEFVSCAGRTSRLAGILELYVRSVEEPLEKNDSKTLLQRDSQIGAWPLENLAVYYAKRKRLLEGTTSLHTNSKFITSNKKHCMRCCCLDTTVYEKQSDRLPLKVYDPLSPTLEGPSYQKSGLPDQISPGYADKSASQSVSQCDPFISTDDKPQNCSGKDKAEMFRLLDNVEYAPTSNGGGVVTPVTHLPQYTTTSPLRIRSNVTGISESLPPQPTTCSHSDTLTYTTLETSPYNLNTARTSPVAYPPPPYTSMDNLNALSVNVKTEPYSIGFENINPTTVATVSAMIMAPDLRSPETELDRTTTNDSNPPHNAYNSNNFVENNDIYKYDLPPKDPSMTLPRVETPSVISRLKSNWRNVVSSLSHNTSVPIPLTDLITTPSLSQVANNTLIIKEPKNSSELNDSLDGYPINDYCNEPNQPQSKYRQNQLVFSGSALPIPSITSPGTESFGNDRSSAIVGDTADSTCSKTTETVYAALRRELNRIDPEAC